MKPRVSLLWLTLAVVLLALLTSQAIAILLLREYVGKPRAARGIVHLVDHLRTISAALETMPPPEEDRFMARVHEIEGVQILRSDLGPERLGMTLAREGPHQAQLRRQLQNALGENSDLYVRYKAGVDATPMLWVLLRHENQHDYWVGVPRHRIEPMFTKAAILWSAAGLAIAFLAASFMVWRLNLPLRSVLRAANRLGEGRDPGPVPESGPTELRLLARAFNRMNESLNQFRRERATSLAGISHDLRTPLSHLRLELEIHRDKLDAETQAAMVADLESMDEIVEQFIEYARCEASEASEPQELGDLSRLVEDSIRRWSRLGAEVHADLAILPPLWFRPLAMRRLLSNLLSNAFRHASGAIEVRTAACEENAVISVLDRGAGIPPDQVDRLKQPFTRKDDSRSPPGAGLGLAIVEHVALLHHGRLDLLPRDGGGLEARVTLPLATSP